MSTVTERPVNGLTCPKCGCHGLKVSYRKPYNGGYRRVRICTECKHRVRTFESIR